MQDEDSGVALINIPLTTGELSLLPGMWQQSVPCHRSKGITSLEYGVGVQQKRGVFSLAALAQSLGVVQVTQSE